MKAAVKQNIVQTFHDLNEIFSSFSENEINITPYEGSWTAGQTVQHIVLAGSGYPELFAGKTEKTTRNPEEKVKDLEALF
ncbi:DinB family protein [Flavobacterium sp. FlaQc-30]|uniref:DinB family protein n=1 Tax=Flavobacterium sp. FlaQc-30 TaxID=3374179 RepID=UPI00375750C3